MSSDWTLYQAELDDQDNKISEADATTQDASVEEPAPQQAEIPGIKQAIPSIEIPTGSDTSEDDTPEAKEPEGEQKTRPVIELPSDDVQDVENDPFAQLQIDYLDLLMRSEADVSALNELLVSGREEAKKSINATRFIEDNLAAVSLLNDSRVAEVHKHARQQIKKDTDVSSVWASIFDEVQKSYTLSSAIFHLSFMFGSRHDAFRKLAAALIGGAVHNEKVMIPTQKGGTVENFMTKCHSVWGSVFLGDWILRENDISALLSSEQQKMLSDGSPSEREAAKSRLVVESVVRSLEAEKILILTVGTSGDTWNDTVIDLGSWLRSSFADGTLRVIAADGETNKPVVFNTEGNVVPYMPFKMTYRDSEEGSVNDAGLSIPKSTLVVDLTGDSVILKANAKELQQIAGEAMLVGERKWQGKKGDLESIRRCVPDGTEVLLKRCSK